MAHFSAVERVAVSSGAKRAEMLCGPPAFDQRPARHVILQLFAAEFPNDCSANGWLADEHLRARAHESSTGTGADDPGETGFSAGLEPADRSDLLRATRNGAAVPGQGGRREIFTRACELRRPVLRIAATT